MDPDLKQYLDGMHIELRTEMKDMRTELRTEMKDMRTELRGEIEKVETNLLRAFHGWARAMEIRVRGVSAVAVGFEERLAMAEERISEVERRRAS